MGSPYRKLTASPGKGRATRKKRARKGPIPPGVIWLASAALTVGFAFHVSGRSAWIPETNESRERPGPVPDEKDDSTGSLSSASTSTNGSGGVLLSVARHPERPSTEYATFLRRSLDRFPLNPALDKLVRKCDESDDPNLKLVAAFLVLSDLRKQIVPAEANEAEVRLVAEMSRFSTGSLNAISELFRQTGDDRSTSGTRLDLYDLIVKLPAVESGDLRDQVLAEMRRYGQSDGSAPYGNEGGTIYSPIALPLFAARAYAHLAGPDVKAAKLAVRSTLSENSSPAIRTLYENVIDER